MASTKAKTEVEAAALAPVTSIKGFYNNLQCRGFQFEIGKTYTTSGKIKACENGFHACPAEHHPLSVLEFYPPTSRFCEVTQDGKRDAEGSKLASASITIGAEISIGDLATRAVKWVFDRANWKDAASVTGDNEGATASGVRGAATASGDSGAATASGDRGAATASGYRGAATASSATSAAFASGRNGRVRGVDGASLHIDCVDGDGKKLAAWAGIVGKNGIKSNTWYSLNADGTPFEAESA
jgi:hypothetical protein